MELLLLLQLPQLQKEQQQQQLQGQEHAASVTQGFEVQAHLRMLRWLASDPSQKRCTPAWDAVT